MDQLYRVYVRQAGMVTDHRTFDNAFAARIWFLAAKKTPTLQQTGATLLFANRRKVLDRHIFTAGDVACVH